MQKITSIRIIYYHSTVWANSCQTFRDKWKNRRIFHNLLCPRAILLPYSPLHLPLRSCPNSIISNHKRWRTFNSMPGDDKTLCSSEHNNPTTFFIYFSLSLYRKVLVPPTSKIHSPGDGQLQCSKARNGKIDEKDEDGQRILSAIY